MKKLKIMLLIAIALLAIACKQPKDTAVSGIYVTAFKNEFNITNDTLIVTAYNAAANSYQVERRSGYHLIRDGKVLPKKFEVETWMATFDENKQLLQQTGFGKQIYIDPDGKFRAFGSSYQKIK